MTWVLGAGMPFGYGALISDVRVTFPNGQYLDKLQKIHTVGNGLMMGFAGSVDVGFWMLKAMRHQWGHPEPGRLYPVKHMVWHWHRFARWFFNNMVTPQHRALGCELFIAGVSPEGHAFGQFAHAALMRAPEFEPVFVHSWIWGSIGSGVAHQAAPHFADQDAFMTVFAHGEVGNQGGAAIMVAHSVANDLERNPMTTVSPVIQVGIVRATTQDFKLLQRQRQGAWTVASEQDVAPGTLITSWRGFVAVAAEAGLDAQAAVA